MSHDIYLEIDTGGEYPACVFSVGNYTSNVSPMWAAALGHPLADLHGRGAADSLLALDAAIAAMAAEPARFEAMNPPNGWGSYEGALAYLQQLAHGCRTHPKTTIRISH
jgi:hypothetical protein